MALLNIQQIGFGTLLAPAAVSASDTINVDPQGLVLEVINGGGSPDTVTIVDPGTTPAGSAATNPTQAVAAGTRRHFRLNPAYANTNGIITVTHSFTTSVTYNLIRA